MITRGKRWRDAEARWSVPTDVFDPRGFDVDVIAETPAKSYVVRNHYSRSFPAARLRIGMFGAAARMVGAVVFSVPQNDAVLPCYFDDMPSVELGRLVLDHDVGFNGETWLIARALRFAREVLGVRAVLSYADPVAQYDLAGALKKPEHWGTIYQASNALHLGRAKADTKTVAADGTVISRRALSKIRNGEVGADYAARQLTLHGAPARGFAESPSEWLQRTLASPAFRRVRHPGNLVYAFGLDKGARAQLTIKYGTGEVYPKKDAA